MFTLATVSDSIRLDPETFDKSHHTALSEAINEKFANKVLPEVGLCIALYDVHSANDGILRDGDGAIFVDCTFRLIIFAPFVGEILAGWISSCTPEGINVRMEFFDDIFIPSQMLFEGTEFVAQEQAWAWNIDEAKLFLDTNEKMRFRVEQITFGKHGMKVFASCSTEGLGLISWWLEQ